ncbi:hypothetical protein QYM36_019428 [Artemia franciscana]|uniref:Peptidase S74 domain-containing protein n=1 Tax=Artemia franciscana TaxID=6661 RepID=A0AA88HAL0_ARTSF|nr:hypothetical protein QYM36_019428 [Artemia franciscana]
MFSKVFPSSVLDDLEVTGDSSGLNVKVAAGAGYVRGHYYASTAIETLTIDAGDGNPRIDTVVLRLEYGSVNDIHLVVVKGTPAASPVAPSLTQTETGVYEFPLANVAVAAGAVTISAGNVTDRRLMFAAAFQAAVGIELAWSQITGKPSTFAPSAHTHAGGDITSGTVAFGRLPTGTGSTQVAIGNHTHDSRYYTESEVDSLLSGKANSSHNHSASQITSGTLSFSRLPTGTGSSEVAVGNHIHDTRYYTQALIDSAFSSRDADISYVQAGNMTSAVYNRDLGGVTRRATWVSNGGALGYASSLREHKQDIAPAGLAREVLTQIPVVQYRYKAQVALQQQNPEHHVAVEIGTLADDLHALGLWQFVTYDGHGEGAAPQGVHYELLGLAAIALGQILADELDTVRERLDSIEDRLTAWRRDGSCHRTGFAPGSVSSHPPPPRSADRTRRSGMSSVATST